MSSTMPRSIIDCLLFRFPNDDQWKRGVLCKRARQAEAELIEREYSDLPAIREQVENVIDLLESPIEQVAAYHLLGRNYAPFTSADIVFSRMYRSLPEKWPVGVVVAIVPQVEVGRYRVDFMVHLRNGAKFAVECDGEEFHDGVKDGSRDSALARHFQLPVLRFSGSQIWESPLWTNEVRKTVFMLMGMRNAERVDRRG